VATRKDQYLPFLLANLAGSGFTLNRQLDQHKAYSSASEHRPMASARGRYKQASTAAASPYPSSGVSRAFMHDGAAPAAVRTAQQGVS
jgi:hypothetical protein